MQTIDFTRFYVRPGIGTKMRDQSHPARRGDSKNTDRADAEENDYWHEGCPVSVRK
jgi:hypothetical protein